jgi:hypothetical protein
VATADVDAVPVSPVQPKGDTSSGGTPMSREAWGRVMDAGAVRGAGGVMGAAQGATEVSKVGNEATAWGLAVGPPTSILRAA